MNERAVKDSLCRPCPICSNNTGEILHTQKFVIPDGYPLPESYDVICCLKCEFVYADTSTKQKDYDLYYRYFSKYEDPNTATGSGITSWDRDRCDVFALEISRLVPDTQASIIDIGCANGGLLGALNHRGYNNLTGLDPSTACIEYIKRNHDISKAIVGGIFSQSIVTDKSLQGSFDCAIFSGVMEHIYDVQKAMKNVWRLLKDGGSLYLEVPDASRYFDHYVVPYYYFDSEHINHFDRHSLNNLFIVNGFDFTSCNEKDMRASASNIYPSITFMGEKRLNGKAVKTEPIPDSTVKNSVLKYIQKSKTAERAIRTKLEPFVKKQNPVIIWGAGNFTMRLLTESLLGKCNIVAFIDNDANKWGKTMRGVSIYPPDKVKELHGTLIICAAVYSDDILLQAKATVITNEIIVLK